METTETVESILYDALKHVDDNTQVRYVDLKNYEYQPINFGHFLISPDDKQEVLVGSNALKQICKVAKVPSKFVENSSPELDLAIFQEWYPKIKKGEVQMLTANGNTVVRAVMSPKFVRVPNYKIFDLMRRVLPEGVEYTLIGGGFDDFKTAILWKSVSPCAEERFDTDEVQVSFHTGGQVILSEMGHPTLTVNPLIWVNNSVVGVPNYKLNDQAVLKYKNFDSAVLGNFLETAQDLSLEATHLLADHVAKDQPIFSEKELVDYVTDLSLIKGCPSTITKLVDKMVEAEELIPMTTFEMGIKLITRLQAFDQPIKLGLERAIARSWNFYP